MKTAANSLGLQCTHVTPTAMATSNAQLARSPTRFRRNVLVCCGTIAVLGSFSFIVTDIAAALAAQPYNPISETVSALTVGKTAPIQDMGIDLYAIALIAVAVGLFWLQPSRSPLWISCLLLLVASAIVLFTIAENSAHGPLSQSGSSVHGLLVLVLFSFSALAFIGLALEAKRVHRGLHQLTLYLGLPFCAFGVPYFFVPQSIEGGYERFLVLLILIWTLGVARIFFLQSGLSSILSS